jgi:hypothetical protein
MYLTSAEIHHLSPSSPSQLSSEEFHQPSKMAEKISTIIFLLYQILRTYSIPILLTILTLHLFHNKYGHGISQISGPWLTSITPFWRVHSVMQGNSHKTMIALHKMHGKLVRIAPNVIDISDPTMIPIIYNLKGDFKKVRTHSVWSASEG